MSINGAPRIYILEVHRKTETKVVTEQLRRYMEVLETGAVAEKYDLEVSPFICSVHMKDNVLRGVKSALCNTPSFEPFKGAFLFNAYDNVANDIANGWTFAIYMKAQPFE